MIDQIEALHALVGDIIFVGFGLFVLGYLVQVLMPSWRWLAVSTMLLLVVTVATHLGGRAAAGQMESAGAIAAFGLFASAVAMIFGGALWGTLVRGGTLIADAWLSYRGRAAMHVLGFAILLASFAVLAYQHART